jgi:hypothetical protein
MGFVIDSTAAVPGVSRQAERVHPVVRLLPSLTDVTVILTIVFLFGCLSGTHTLLGDGDTGWHIRTGQWILAHGQVPHQDLFSYTMPGRPWFAWEWLWDVCFAAVYNSFGLGGVVLGSLAVLCATMAVLFRLTLRKCGNVLAAFLVTAVAVAGTSLHWLARPHLFTLLFAVIFYSILERVKDSLAAGDRRHARRLLYSLPALTVIWTNLHAGFLLGMILAGTYGAGEIARLVVEPAAGRKSAWERAAHYLAATAACALASLANPYFFSLHRHIFEYFHDDYTFTHILEFQTLSFHSPLAWTLEIMMVLGAIAAFRELGRREFVYTILLVGWLHLALLSARNIPIFLVLAAPPVAAAVTAWIADAAQAPAAAWLRRGAASFERLAAEVGETDRIPRLHLASAAALAAVAAIMYAPAPPEKFRAEYDPKRYPAKAIEFLGGAGISNRIFADDEWGDYLVYRLYPTRVFVDGRSDFYGPKFNQQFIDLLNVKYTWQQTLDRYRVDTVLLPTEAPLAGALKESHNWRVAYDDGVAIVFRPSAARATPGEQVSAVLPGGGTGRDRKITKSQDRGLTITQTT